MVFIKLTLENLFAEAKGSTKEKTVTIVKTGEHSVKKATHTRISVKVSWRPSWVFLCLSPATKWSKRDVSLLTYVFVHVIKLFHDSSSLVAQRYDTGLRVGEGLLACSLIEGVLQKKLSSFHPYYTCHWNTSETWWQLIFLRGEQCNKSHKTKM